MYAIGKVATMSNISVRTLRYYDEIGLLPAEKNVHGHRYYTDEDVSKLHYILTLRDLGLPLDSIQTVLSDRQLKVRDVLEMRLQMIQAEIKQLKRMEASINSLWVLAEIEQHTDWESIFATFYTFPNSEKILKKIWAKQFSEEELEVLLEHPDLGGIAEQSETTISLIKDVRANLHKNPTSETAQNLAKRWIALVEEMYKGNTALANKVWDASQHQEVTGFYQYEKELVVFIEKAIQHYYESQIVDQTT